MEQTKKAEIRGSLLHYPASFWEQFIKDGKLDKEKVVAGGFDGEGQADWIEGEMVKLGWLEGGDSGSGEGEQGAKKAPARKK